MYKFKQSYSLKQSPCAWFGRFSAIVTEYGFQRAAWHLVSKSECTFTSLYHQVLNGIYLLCMWWYSDYQKWKWWSWNQNSETLLGTCFQTKNLSPLKYFFRLKISIEKECAYLNKEELWTYYTKVKYLVCSPRHAIRVRLVAIVTLY